MSSVFPIDVSMQHIHVGGAVMFLMFLCHGVVEAFDIVRSDVFGAAKHRRRPICLLLSFFVCAL